MRAGRGCIRASASAYSARFGSGDESSVSGADATAANKSAEMAGEAGESDKRQCTGNPSDSKGKRRAQPLPATHKARPSQWPIDTPACVSRVRDLMRRRARLKEDEVVIDVLDISVWRGPGNKKVRIITDGH